MRAHSADALSALHAQRCIRGVLSAMPLCPWQSHCHTAVIFCADLLVNSIKGFYRDGEVESRNWPCFKQYLKCTRSAACRWTAPSGLRWAMHRRLISTTLPWCEGTLGSRLLLHRRLRLAPAGSADFAQLLTQDSKQWGTRRDCIISIDPLR